MTKHWKSYIAAVVVALAATSLANYSMDYRGLRLKKKKKSNEVTQQQNKTVQITT